MTGGAFNCWRLLAVRSLKCAYAKDSFAAIAILPFRPVSGGSIADRRL